MKKFIFLILMFSFVLSADFSRAQPVKYPTVTVMGVVTAVSPAELRITQKYAQGYYFLYIFKVTNQTRINGQVQKGALVSVKYFQTDIIGGFFTTAIDIQVLHAPGAQYQRMF